MITDSECILIELLLCLPAKSLIRFKLVSKRWLSIISSNYFSHRHARRHCLSKPELSLILRLPKTPHHYYLQSTNHCLSKPELSLILRLPKTPHHYYLQSTNHEARLVPYNFPSALEDPVICSFSNGLFLLYCPSEKQDCHVYNPATRQSRKISFNTNEMYPIVAGLNIVFDPVKSPCYKIVCVRYARRRISGFFMSHSRPRRCQIEVYESDTGTWSVCGERFFAPSYLDFDHGIYWNNGIHWGGIFFDLDKNVVVEHPRFVVPDGDGRITFDVSYVEWNGGLHCIANYPEKKLVAVFELQRDYSQWLMKHHIDLDRDFGPFSVLSMVGGCSEEDDALLIHKPGKIMAYGFAEKSFEKVVDFKDETFYQENCVQFVSGSTSQFIETLYPV